MSIGSGFDRGNLVMGLFKRACKDVTATKDDEGLDDVLVENAEIVVSLDGEKKYLIDGKWIDMTKSEILARVMGPIVDDYPRNYTIYMTRKGNYVLVAVQRYRYGSEDEIILTSNEEDVVGFFLRHPFTMEEHLYGLPHAIREKILACER